MNRAIHTAQTAVLAAHDALDSMALSDAIAVRDALLKAQETISDLERNQDLLREHIHEQERRLERAHCTQGTLQSNLIAERKKIKVLQSQLDKQMGRPPVEVPAVSHLELIRLDRVLSRLFASDEDTDVILGNQSLAYVTQLLDEIERVRPATKGQSAA